MSRRSIASQFIATWLLLLPIAPARAERMRAYYPAGTQACQMPPNDYTHITYGDFTLNARTLWMLNLASVLYNGPGDVLRVTQGSYSDAVAASFGTHAGGGAVDISVRAKDAPHRLLTTSEANDMVMALRWAGFAAWLRLPGDLKATQEYHIHAIAIGDQELSPAARRQLTGPEGYLRGRDGVPPQEGGPRPDRLGGPVVCDWMIYQGYHDMRFRWVAR